MQRNYWSKQENGDFYNHRVGNYGRKVTQLPPVTCFDTAWQHADIALIDG